MRKSKKTEREPIQAERIPLSLPRQKIPAE
jgi:hypothetical protein